MRLVVLASAAIVALSPTAARAQESPEEQARQAFLRGVAAMQQSRYATAIAELEFSYGLLPRCSTQFNLAVAFEQTRRYADSLDVFQRYQADCADTMPAQNVTYLADAMRRLRPRVGTLSLRVTPAAEVASVSLDRHPRPRWTDDLAVDPGAHTVEVRARDGQVVRREFQAAEGSRAVLEVSLGVGEGEAARAVPLNTVNPYEEDTSEGARPPPSPLRIEAPVAHASVFVDGRDQGEVPVEARFASGRHLVEVRADGYRPARFAMTLRDGAATRLAPRLERDGEASSATPFYGRWWFWTLVGAAVVGGAVALTWQLSQPADAPVYTFQAVTAP